ncbi:MAG: hypothetical protein ACJ79R_20530 [Anaeromyxobacteraceae bacterium]
MTTQGAPGAEWMREHAEIAALTGELAKAEEALENVRALLRSWRRNRADPRFGGGAPSPLFVAGMAAAADSMIAELQAVLLEIGREP